MLLRQAIGQQLRLVYLARLASECIEHFPRHLVHILQKSAECHVDTLSFILLLDKLPCPCALERLEGTSVGYTDWDPLYLTSKLHIKVRYVDG